MTGVAMAVDDGFRPGIVWSARREGSRAADRTVLKLGPLPGKGYAAVYYRSGDVESWCTVEAWRRWASKEQATFAAAAPAGS